MGENPFEDLLNTMHSHYVQVMQREMQKVLKKVHEMPTESWREKRVSLTANVVFDLLFMDTKPNYCIVMNNSVDQTVYVSRFPNVSSTNFEFKVLPGTRIQWLWGRGIEHLFFVAVGEAAVFVQSYESDFNPAAIQLFQGNPVPVSVSGSLANVKGAVVNVIAAGTRVQLPDVPCNIVTITAKRANTGYIYIGGADVSSTVYGDDLSSKESFTLQIANLNQLYIDSSVSGEGISYVAI